jgi:hypothetical protein
MTFHMCLPPLYHQHQLLGTKLFWGKQIYLGCLYLSSLNFRLPLFVINIVFLVFMFDPDSASDKKDLVSPT